MPVVVEHAEEIIAAWRRGVASAEGWENPAGPPLIGEYTEEEITMSLIETKRPSSCTAGGGFCC
ncbi:DUF6229 family protein [Sphaerisporangium album]|uniref:DUF6229 family protein n=1 Tax=Sphaerisporangium album TaxID=509200 RepID=UPI0011C0512D|nr:DUF6229 family protein [Sphaerisporangium album]